MYRSQTTTTTTTTTTTSTTTTPATTTTTTTTTTPSLVTDLSNILTPTQSKPDKEHKQSTKKKALVPLPIPIRMPISLLRSLPHHRQIWDDENRHKALRNRKLKITPEAAEFFGMSSDVVMSRQHISMLINIYIQKHDLYHRDTLRRKKNPNDLTENIYPDSKLRKLLNVPITKQLSRYNLNEYINRLIIYEPTIYIWEGHDSKSNFTQKL
tara:strand:- start:508 stop:1140 length:633 start_codon:yes stop_codon:yes gene_type:complete